MLYENSGLFKKYISSRQIQSKNFFNKYIKHLRESGDDEEVIVKRKTYLDLLILKLSNIPRDIAEITFNLFHVCFKLEEELKKSFMSMNQEENIDDCINIFCDNSFLYLFYTCLYVITKLYGGCNYHIKVKETIIESNLNFNIILLCEILLMNFIDWKLFLFSPSEMIYTFLNCIQVPENILPYLQLNIENYVNYVMSEFLIYSSFDLSVISVAVCKLALSSVNSTNNPYLGELDKFIFEFYSREEVDSCVNMINYMINEPDSEDELEEEKNDDNHKKVSIVF